MKDWFIGVIDIVLILLALLVAVIGFKKGFMKKALGIIGIIAIIVFAVMFAGHFADWLTSVKMPPSEALYNHYYEKAMTNIAAGIEHKGDNESVNAIASLLSIPYWIAWVVHAMLGKPEIAGDAVAVLVATKITHFIMTVIAFFIIVFGVLIIIGILKMIANALRESAFVRVIDGFLGILLYLAIFAAFVCVILMIFRFVFEKNPTIQDTNSFMGWIYNDLHLGDDKFRITKALYNNNIIYNFVHLFF